MIRNYNFEFLKFFFPYLLNDIWEGMRSTRTRTSYTTTTGVWSGLSSTRARSSRRWPSTPLSLTFPTQSWARILKFPATRPILCCQVWRDNCPTWIILTTETLCLVVTPPFWMTLPHYPFSLWPCWLNSPPKMAEPVCVHTPTSSPDILIMLRIFSLTPSRWPESLEMLLSSMELSNTVPCQIRARTSEVESCNTWLLFI